jgi:hypothetical protein
MSLPGQSAYHLGQPVDALFTGGAEARFAFGRGTQILPRQPLALAGYSSVRTVEDAGEKWFEMGIKINSALDGSPDDGWEDPEEYFRLVPQYSIDLVSWQENRFITPPANPVTDHGGGTYTYWQRARNPIDSAQKSGAIYFAVDGIGDARNNPFIGLTIAGVEQALPRFPYTMPQDAAALQEDLIAAGWVGATVTATTDRDWRITIPSVNFTSYAQASKIFWPLYLVPDIFDDVVNPVDGADARGSFIDPSGETLQPKGFGRFRIEPGPRYGPLMADRYNDLRRRFGLAPIPTS